MRRSVRTDRSAVSGAVPRARRYTSAMAQATQTGTDVEQLRAEWAGRVAALVDQVAGWATAEGWAVDRGSGQMADRRFGTYAGAAAVLSVPEGEVAVTPLAPSLLGRGGGWVDIEARPSFSHVRLWGRSGDWEVIVGSNIPLRRPWTRETFVQLVTDMLS